MGRTQPAPDNPHTNWILCVTRNGIEFTRPAVRSFLAQDIGNIRIMMIDNHSTDGTVEWAMAMYPRILLLPQGVPLSVSQAWNIGLKSLFAQGNDRVLVCNNDVELSPWTYEMLARAPFDFVTAVGVDSKDQMEDMERTDYKTRPHPDFSCYLVRARCWDKVGPFDEQFQGAYGEDCDYHCRMHKEGVEAVSLDLPYYHAACGTIKSNERDEVLIQRAARRNREYFHQKWGFEIGSKEYEEYFSSSTTPEPQ